MPSDQTDDFWQRVEQLFQEAWDLETPARAAFLAEACGGDQRLRDAVENLLHASTEAEANPLWNETALRNEARFLATAEDTTALERYRLIERIGAGGMGVVYKAVRADDEFSKLVAVKIVQDSDPATVGRLRQERQILAGLEFIAGLPIDRYVAERQPPVRELLELFRKICAAVSYAHRNLIVHRDLKPGNILVTAEGQPKLLDFGIAKLLDGSAQRTKTGAGAMTPEYASPEQVLGAPITTASDIYSLGVLLYELLTGQAPFQGATLLATLEQVRSGQPAPPRRFRAGASRRRRRARVSRPRPR